MKSKCVLFMFTSLHRSYKPLVQSMLTENIIQLDEGVKSLKVSQQMMSCDKSCEDNQILVI